MKRFPIYPYLFIIYLVLDLLSHNLGQIDISQSIRSTLGLLLVTALIMLLLRVLRVDWRLASYIAFLVLFFFFINGHVYRVLQNAVTLLDTRWLPLIVMLVWGLLVAIGGFIFWRLIPNKKDLTLFLNIVFIVSLLPAGYRFIQGWSGGLGNIVSSTKEVNLMSDPAVHGDLLKTDGIHLQSENSPDIYVIVLDGYGRSDVLDELYEFDNSDFITGLQSRGFYVAEKSRANYIQTFLSLSALFNFDYFENWEIRESEVGYMNYVRIPVAQNRLFKLLDEVGYMIITIANGYEVHLLQNVDQRFNPFANLNNFESLIISGTPLVVVNEYVNLGLLPSQTFELQRRLVNYSFDQLGAFAPLPGPKLVFVHIVSPHPPFVFAQDGNPVQPNHAFTWADGSHYEGDTSEYVNGYQQQAIYVTEKILSTIDSILENSTEPPIIVLQSDHGPGSLLDWETDENTCLWERSSILNAYYFPGDGVEGVYADITPVNTFRLILSTYFGANLELLDDRAYYTPWGAGATMTEITDRIDAKENCNR